MVAVSPLNQPQTTDDEEQPDSSGTLASYLKGGPEGAALQLMQQQRGAVGAQQQKLLEMMNQQQGPLSQTGMSDLDKASLMFQAAGALGQTTRSGGFGETLGNLATSVAGPLSKAAEAQRQRQSQLQQLQLARQKLAVEMTGQQGVPAADMLSLIKSQRERTDSETESFEPKLIAPGKYALVGDAGTIKPIPAELLGRTGAADSDSLTGEDHLKNLPPTRANQIRAILSGDQTVPPIGTVPYKRMEEAGIIDDISRAVGNDPDEFKKVVSGTIAQTNKSFATGGKNASLMNSLAKSFNHLNDYQERVKDLPNLDPGIFTGTANKIANAMEQSTGGSAYLKALTIREVLASELAGYFKNATGGSASPAQKQIEHMLEIFPLNGNAEQKQAAIDELRSAIMGQAEPLVEKFKADGGSKSKGIVDAEDYIRKIYPSAAKSIDNLNANPIPGSARYIAMQKQKAQQQAAQAQDGAQPPAVTAQPAPGQAPASSGNKSIARTGMVNSGPNAGKRVILYSDGTREYQ